MMGRKKKTMNDKVNKEYLNDKCADSSKKSDVPIQKIRLYWLDFAEFGLPIILQV